MDTHIQLPIQSVEQRSPDQLLSSENVRTLFDLGVSTLHSTVPNPSDEKEIVRPIQSVEQQSPDRFYVWIEDICGMYDGINVGMYYDKAACQSLEAKRTEC